MARPRNSGSRYKRTGNKTGGHGSRRAVLYARVSTRDQEQEGYSIPAQIKLLEDYAALNGLTIASSHVDVETARKAGRVAFGEMLRYLRRHPDIRILLVEKTDRLYRNVSDWAIIDDLDIEVHFVKENFVLSDECPSAEKFMHGIKVLVAKSYIDNLSEEATKGMQEKARQGLWPSYAPVGYRNIVGPDKRKIVAIDPATGPLVARLFEWFATGSYSLKALTKRARLAGLKGRRHNRPIALATVHRILRNPFYTGTFEWAGETHAGSHEPLVSTELWEAAQDILDNRATSNVRAEPHMFAFARLVQCGHCGCALVAQIKKGRYIYYHCSGYRGKCPERYLREEALEGRFVAALRLLECSDGEFELLRKAMGAESFRADKNRVHGSFQRKGQFAGAPGALVRDGIDLLDLARNAHRSLPMLSAETKQQLLGLLLSHCTWAQDRLDATFQQPFVLFAQWLVNFRRRGVGAGTEHSLAVLRECFHDPSSDTRRLIARYNAMMGDALETRQGSDLLHYSWEPEAQAA